MGYMMLRVILAKLRFLTQIIMSHKNEEVHNRSYDVIIKGVLLTALFAGK